MREITRHRDGYGLTDKHRIDVDDRDPKAGNASHHYLISPADGPASEFHAMIQFQHGPRAVEGSEDGIVDVELVCVLMDRFDGFQSGPFACDENRLILDKLREIKALMVDRANVRAVQKVLGLNKAHAS